MGTTLSRLSPPQGARKKPKRLGRGPGSGQGTTAGKGTKGQRSRAGAQISPGFEGGQMPLQRRLPKRGFKNRFRVEYAPVNVGQLAKVFASGESIDIEQMKAKGTVPRSADRVKVLGDGQITSPLTIRAHAFSQAAMDKIQAAGGTAEVIVIERKKPARGVKKAKAGKEKG
jgi:large subunit ribosomal protein L15